MTDSNAVLEFENSVLGDVHRKITFSRSKSGYYVYFFPSEKGTVVQILIINVFHQMSRERLTQRRV
jgi:hypothetical protein